MDSAKRYTPSRKGGRRGSTEGIASVITVMLIPALVKSGIEAMIAAGKHVAAWVMAGAAALE